SSLPVIHASHVVDTSGTGLVHCAPAHGPEDYSALKSLGLLSSGLICHVDSGNFSADISQVVGERAAESLVGKPVLGEGGKAMVALLKETGALLKIQRVKQRYPYDWRSKRPVIITYVALIIQNSSQTLAQGDVTVVCQLG